MTELLRVFLNDSTTEVKHDNARGILGRKRSIRSGSIGQLASGRDGSPNRPSMQSQVGAFGESALLSYDCNGETDTRLLFSPSAAPLLNLLLALI